MAAWFTAQYDPAFGVLDASGRQTLFTPRASQIIVHNVQGFLLSAEGATVQFGYEQFGKSPARFSLVRAQVGRFRRNQRRERYARCNRPSQSQKISPSPIGITPMSRS